MAIYWYILSLNPFNDTIGCHLQFIGTTTKTQISRQLARGPTIVSGENQGSYLWHQNPSTAVI